MSQGDLGFGTDAISDDRQRYDPLPIVNEIRQHVSGWRSLPNSKDWGVTPTTARLLTHWRSHAFEGIRPFFCQIEAVETAIWLSEVAPKQGRYKRYVDHVKNANIEANPDLFRVALKMATGAGKTTVMAMLIAWQTLNAVRAPGSKRFSRGFLIVAPGITIRDRLRVLLPSDGESYYGTRELVPSDMLDDLSKAKVVVTNFHAFKPGKALDVNKTSEALLQGRGERIRIEETEGDMVRRVAKDLMGVGPIIAINDEAHHCYRRKPGSEVEKYTGDERKEAEKNEEEARIWINGLEAVKRKLGIHAVYDLSATPFFLSGSGYAEGTLFPWTVTDFSLMDAIESGIVKLPRIPVADNLPTAEVPVYRNLWDHIGKHMPKKARASDDAAGGIMPDELQPLQSALHSLYAHYRKEFDAWRQAGIEVPPVFIVVCNNTASSKLVYDWIAGWEAEDESGDRVMKHAGHLDLFSNFDEHGNRLARPNTLLIDSAQLESGEGLDKNFRAAASAEIEQFKREIVERSGQAAGDIADADLLREVMNTVGQKGRLGERVRCVVSVSMLTEGWDANTVTHILGVRAFGTQLLCEQVVGRGLRRVSYELNDEGLFDTEYSNILGIPFNFAAKPTPAAPKPPKPSTRVEAVAARSDLEIRFPRVTGYRIDLPPERLRAEFSDDSSYRLTPDEVGPTETVLEGIVGEGVLLETAKAKDLRPSSLVMHLAKIVLARHFQDEDGTPKLGLFNQVHRICREWIEGDHLECAGETAPWMVISYPLPAARVSEKIYAAIARSMVGEDEREGRIKAILDTFNPEGSTRHVGFNTRKGTYATDARCSHVSHVAMDSGWEGEFARVAEEREDVLAYVKNQGLGLEVPYRDGNVPRMYLPDFILRVDTGADEPLNLIVEVKGYRGEASAIKAETMKTQWIPGVNNLGSFGRWAFAELRDVYDFKPELERVIAAIKQESR